MKIMAYLLLLLILLIAFVTDSRARIIPNKLTGIACVLGLGISLFTAGLGGLWQALIGGAVGFGVFFLLYLCGGVGGGDVKIFATIGIFTGMEFVLYCSLYSIFYGGLIGLWILIWRREFFARTRNVLTVLSTRFGIGSRMHKQHLSTLRFPFMWAVLPGFLTTYYEFFL
jgi:prepilin peptidase CpaA